jgi:chromate transporter
MRKVLDVFLAFLRLGCTSFGGPIAHLAYFQRELVERRRWLDDAAFGECVALTQLLPGPASSQTGMLLGWLRAGPVGAWIGFTLPSAILMAAFALALPHANVNAGWLRGLPLVAVAVVASALVSMRGALAPDLVRSLLAIAVFALILLAPPLPIVTPVAIAGSALVGLLLPGTRTTAEPKLDLHLTRGAGITALALLVVTFVVLGIWAATGAHLAILTNTLFRIGSLVFGGGHVVLPLLQTQAVAAGIVDNPTILAGYAAIQYAKVPAWVMVILAALFGYVVER